MESYNFIKTLFVSVFMWKKNQQFSKLSRPITDLYEWGWVRIQREICSSKFKIIETLCYSRRMSFVDGFRSLDLGTWISCLYYICVHIFSESLFVGAPVYHIVIRRTVYFSSRKTFSLRSLHNKQRWFLEKHIRLQSIIIKRARSTREIHFNEFFRNIVYIRVYTNIVNNFYSHLCV